MPRDLGIWKVKPEGQRLRRFKTFEGAAKHAVRMFATGSNVDIVEEGGWTSIECRKGAVISVMEVTGQYSHEQRETLLYLYKEIGEDAA